MTAFLIALVLVALCLVAGTVGGAWVHHKIETSVEPGHRFHISPFKDCWKA